MASRSSVMATLRFAPTSRMVYLCVSDPSNDPTAVQPLLNLQQTIDICPRLGSKLKLPAAHGICSTNSSLPYKTDAARTSSISRARFNGRCGFSFSEAIRESRCRLRLAIGVFTVGYFLVSGESAVRGGD
jgi:hypothetical protein